MFSFQTLFSEHQNDIVERNGFTYHRYFSVNISQKTTMRFTFVESNSPFGQAILILFPRNFAGEILVNEKLVPLRKGAFRKLNFWKKTSPTEFTVTITNFIGQVRICNGSDPLGDMRFCKHLSEGCAMRIEKQGKESFRMYCNDHELDDDCDDLIFDVEIE